MKCPKYMTCIETKESIERVCECAIDGRECSTVKPVKKNMRATVGNGNSLKGMKRERKRSATEVGCNKVMFAVVDNWLTVPMAR